MNELGILIDVSHTGGQTVADALDISKDPIAFTHTCCRAVYKHDRGKTDEQLQAIVEKGGYIGIVNVPFFITHDPNPTLNHMIDHIDHLVDLVGVDYVGIGTDWPTTAPKQYKDLFNEEVRKIGFRPEHRVDAHAVTEGFERQDKWSNITEALVGRGYSDQEVKKIIGGNFLRLFRKVVG
jgi:membrane dipeptidase